MGINHKMLKSRSEVNPDLVPLEVRGKKPRPKSCLTKQSHSPSPRVLEAARVTPTHELSEVQRHRKSFESSLRVGQRAVSPSYTPTSMSVCSNREVSNVIPDIYIQTIVGGFGSNVDLYEEVLKLPRNSSERDIRIAYFRRGREVLAEEGRMQEVNQAATEGDISTNSKNRFQAVSMAYEIVSNPLWREQYHRYGLTSMSDSQSVASSVVSMPGSTSSRVRWNENVEELVFRQDPDEFPHVQAKRRKRKKRKPKIQIDTRRLDEHLAKLDEEAEEHFVKDLFDDLEASIDGLLKFVDGSSSQGSVIDEVGKKKKKGKKSKAGQARPQSYGSKFGSAASPVDDDGSSDGGEEARKWLRRLQGSNDHKARIEHARLLDTKPFDENDEDEHSKMERLVINEGKPPLPLEPNGLISRTKGRANYPKQAQTLRRLQIEYSRISKTDALEGAPGAGGRKMQDGEDPVDVVDHAADQSKAYNLNSQRKEMETSNYGGQDESLAATNSRPLATLHGNEPEGKRKTHDVPSESSNSKRTDDSPLGIESESTKLASGKARETTKFRVDRETSVVDAHNEDVFAGLEDESNPRFVFPTEDTFISVPAGNRLRAESPGGGSMSDLSGSFLSGTHGQGTVAPAARRLLAPSPSLDKVDELGREPPQLTDTSSSGSKEEYQSFNDISQRDDTETFETAASGDEKCEGWCEPDSLAETLSFGSSHTATKTREVRAKKSIRKASSGEDGFLECLFAYIAAVATECTAFGAQVVDMVEWNDTKEGIYKTFTVSDGDMDCMLKILRKEIGRTSSFVSAGESDRAYY